MQISSATQLLSVFSEKRKLSSIQDYGSSRHYIAYAFTIQIKKKFQKVEFKIKCKEDSFSSVPREFTKWKKITFFENTPAQLI